MNFKLDQSLINTFMYEYRSGKRSSAKKNKETADKSPSAFRYSLLRLSNKFWGSQNLPTINDGRALP